MKKITFSPELGAGKSNNFEDLYFKLSQSIVDEGGATGSRNGDTLEYLNFKTIVEDPKARCVGGYGRDINIFFLLAEAMWIWTGRKDVEFLNIFNSNMAQFSDDGICFHAPYGYRIRNYNLHSSRPVNPISIDQLEEALLLLKSNPEDRRVLISIWNPNLDLGIKSKDLPCNDMLMFKIRNGKLYQTIQNRSNDLHLGLPTNVFQFSFIGEIMSKILDIGLGDQVHNSQSLHCYKNHELTPRMNESVRVGHEITLYDDNIYSSMDFNFEFTNGVKERLFLIDQTFKMIIERLLDYHRDSGVETLKKTEYDFVSKLYGVSEYFSVVYDILLSYVVYSKTGRKNDDRMDALNHLYRLAGLKLCGDYLTLAENFFVKRLKSSDFVPNGNDGKY